MGSLMGQEPMAVYPSEYVERDGPGAENMVNNSKYKMN